MKVIELLKKKKTLSFEFFPPKDQEQEKELFNVISQLKSFDPDYVSVTYGAMGNTIARSFHWVEKIKKEFKIEPVAHLTCVAASKEYMLTQLDALQKIGVENILALRGDIPSGEESKVLPVNRLHFASELVSIIKKYYPESCVGVAGYPEKHPEAKNLKEDIQHLREKIDAGADHIVTQLFFDNSVYFSFIDKCNKAGIKTPIIPGIMPITSVKQIKRITGLCGANIPKDLLDRLEKHEDDKNAVLEIGVEQAIKQCVELRKAAPGIHFFVMNRSASVSKIFNALKH